MVSKQRYKMLPVDRSIYNAARSCEENIIGKRIAMARQERMLSLAAFTELLGQYGLTIQRTGISKWESGKSVPNAYQLLAICHALDIENGISYFTGEMPKELDEVGREKLREYKQDLIASGRYKPQMETNNNIIYVDMRVSTLPASAGTGAILDDENFELMRFPADEIPDGAEFGVRVRGDSMEPVYRDGQIVWVKTCKTLCPGDIGLFMYDGNGYIKAYEEKVPAEFMEENFLDDNGVLQLQPVLVSFNDKYDPRPVNPELGFCIVGRILN